MRVCVVGLKGYTSSVGPFISLAYSFAYFAMFLAAVLPLSLLSSLFSLGLPDCRDKADLAAIDPVVATVVSTEYIFQLGFMLVVPVLLVSFVDSFAANRSLLPCPLPLVSWFHSQRYASHPRMLFKLSRIQFYILLPYLSCPQCHKRSWIYMDLPRGSF